MRPKTSPLAVRSVSLSKHAEQVFEEVVLELRRSPWEAGLEQRLEVALDGVHRLDQRRAEVRALGQLEQFVVAGLLWQHQRAALFEIGLISGRFGILPAA